MGSRILTVFFLLAFFFSACQDHKREEQLTRWEQSLKERERQLSLKEADYQSLLQMRDSLVARKDSAVAQIWPAYVNAQWKSTVICEESNCGNYVIGDQRSETWEFQADSAGMFARVLNNKKLVRVYAGRFEHNEIYLHFQTDSAVKKRVTMDVVFDQISQGTIKGTQTITGENNCTAKFSVELARTTPN
jgi:hypothetical protein